MAKSTRALERQTEAEAETETEAEIEAEFETEIDQILKFERSKEQTEVELRSAEFEAAMAERRTAEEKLKKIETMTEAEADSGAETETVAENSLVARWVLQWLLQEQNYSELRRRRVVERSTD